MQRVMIFATAPWISSGYASAARYVSLLLKERGYEVIACEPYIEGDVAGYPNHTLEQAVAACDYSVITLQHNIFKENKDLIASKPYYDCVGLMEK